jgi:hypothetical protein
MKISDFNNYKNKKSKIKLLWSRQPVYFYQGRKREEIWTGEASKYDNS